MPVTYLDLTTGKPFAEQGPVGIPTFIWDGTTLTLNLPGGAALVIGQAGAVTVGAFAGGGQANATALTGIVNRVNVSAAAAPPYDSVKLPAASGGQSVFVANSTANPIQVFGTGADTINGQAAATGITQAPNSVEMYVSVAAGLWVVDAGAGFSGQLLTELAQDNIVAHAGGGQGAATVLTASISRVTTVATAGDSVALPPSAAGLDVYVINHGANPMQVFGQGVDQIDDVAAATGVSQMAGSLVLYSCTSAGKWYSNGIGTGFAGQFPTVSYQDAMTAHAGGGQGAGTPIANVINRFTVVASANDSSLLPASKPGMQITVINAAGANSMNVFPAVGEQVNALGANAAFALAAGKTVTFYCTVAGQWHTILSA